MLGGDYLIVNPNASPAEQEAAFNYAVFDYFTDEGLESIEANIQDRAEAGLYFIPQVLTYFYTDSEYGQKVIDLYSKYDNVYEYPVQAVELYDGKPEAQYQTQEYTER